ncbi:class I SAM-dependent methyltransferase [Amycolatopsis sp. SID8362]|uniref:class I SAM-dependent methyltransferase n=1 Tax=Amycolatopsis sp. SID8362 TaxID=2690346 RepID=UPI00137189EB|nr:class I SAM-dependent methyltransferase [Amycolatopsis sp. SID8362]NBH09624.1 methyltransferase domain-containing protein [Amycolatopsis sp. SID8362]NED46316.1 class I SAM-dependent methyltransferase [Amycolatopsis sp. SID8362]
MTADADRSWADIHGAWGDAHAELYDLVFTSRGKNYENEADDITRIIRSRRPAAESLLDVACGTGAHLGRFGKAFDHTEGVELAEAMRSVARRRLPGVSVHPGDMRTFDLGRTFDAVVCLGNAIACVETLADMRLAVAQLVGHLEPGGVLVVEPGWFPEQFLDGYVGGHLVEEERRIVSRVTHSTRQGDSARVEIKFVVAQPDGIREWTDVFLMKLFTRDEYVSAFEDAGCAVEFADIPWRLGERPHNAPGLFIAVRKDS